MVAYNVNIKSEKIILMLVQYKITFDALMLKIDCLKCVIINFFDLKDIFCSFHKASLK